MVSPHKRWLVSSVLGLFLLVWLYQAGLDATQLMIISALIVSNIVFLLVTNGNVNWDVDVSKPRTKKISPGAYQTIRAGFLIITILVVVSFLD